MDAMGDADALRFGLRPLVILTTTLNFLIIRALAAGPLRLAALRRATGLPAQTTLRGHLSSLGVLGMVARPHRTRPPNAVENELTPQGTRSSASPRVSSPGCSAPPAGRARSRAVRPRA